MQRWTRNVTTERSKVKSRSYQDVANLDHPTNVLTKYQFSTNIGFQNTPWKRFLNSRSLQKQGQRSTRDSSLTMHTYNSETMALPSISFQHLEVSETQPVQDYCSHRTPTRKPDSMVVKYTCTALLRLWVKIYCQFLRRDEIDEVMVKKV